ncbi:hypothetical protein SeLEV6574_g02359 [Synchytrium endobioticum]|uniref:Uncharacterized protein n=1 Tax=Synchytrium endobioticum TaxID=286115 RepID=A0A507D8V3_9FUNG|nr:hypothetical protein SeLEV6574_g02359 [Synchytrium endobioticum]
MTNKRTASTATDRNVKKNIDMNNENYTRATREFIVDTDLPRTREKRVPVYTTNIQNWINQSEDTSLNIPHNTTDEKIPKNIEEAKSLPTWQKWKEAIQSEYKPVKDRNVFTLTKSFSTNLAALASSGFPCPAFVNPRAAASVFNNSSLVAFLSTGIPSSFRVLIPIPYTPSNTCLGM